MGGTRSWFPWPVRTLHQQMGMSRYVRWFRELTLDDIPLVGGKNASLGELYRELLPSGIRVPDGFAVTADAYRKVLASAELEQRIRRELSGLDTGNLAVLAERARRIREFILAVRLPEDVRAEIIEAYRLLDEWRRRRRRSIQCDGRGSTRR